MLSLSRRSLGLLRPFHPRRLSSLPPTPPPGAGLPPPLSPASGQLMQPGPADGHIRIDTSALPFLRPNSPLPPSSPTPLPASSFSTPLERELYQILSSSGPISLSTYSSLCLTHPLHGYYTSSLPVLGAAGDFTTSPEISQLFGEMLALFFASLFKSQSPPPRALRLIELGPGRGTLMKDVLRTLEQFPDVREALGRGDVRLVEKGPEMRKRQAEALGVGLEEAE